MAQDTGTSRDPPDQQKKETPTVFAWILMVVIVLVAGAAGFVAQLLSRPDSKPKAPQSSEEGNAQ